MYDKSGQKHYARCTISRAHNYLRHFKTSITTDSPYKDSFKNSLRSNISSAIKYLNKLL